MNVLKLAVVCIAVVSFTAQGKNTYSTFSLGWALPAAPSKAPTPTGDKALDQGWDAGWTFFGLPFAESGPALSGLAFGGKINFSRWMRDSTLTETTFLGTQGIMRYYIPPVIKPFELFIQAGYGMFIGEHGFSDPDTLGRTSPPTEVFVTKGAKNAGFSFNIGIGWDVIEVTPGLTMVFTKGKPSSWLSINVAMKI